MLKRYQNMNFSIFTFRALWKAYPRGLMLSKFCGTDLRKLCHFVKHLQLTTLNEKNLKALKNTGHWLCLEIAFFMNLLHRCIYYVVLNYFVMKCLEVENTYYFLFFFVCFKDIYINNIEHINLKHVMEEKIKQLSMWEIVL